jgi:hypothetical protein
MIEQLQCLLFAVAGAAQARRRANPAEIATTKHDPVDVALRQVPITLEGSTKFSESPTGSPPMLLVHGSRSHSLTRNASPQKRSVMNVR